MHPARICSRIRSHVCTRSALFPTACSSSCCIDIRAAAPPPSSLLPCPPLPLDWLNSIGFGSLSPFASDADRLLLGLYRRCCRRSAASAPSVSAAAVLPLPSSRLPFGPSLRRCQIPFRRFFYRGYEVHKLLDLTHAELMKLLHARARRHFARGSTSKAGAKLLKRLRQAKKDAPENEKPDTIKTHMRHQIILPEVRPDAHNTSTDGRRRLLGVGIRCQRNSSSERRRELHSNDAVCKLYPAAPPSRLLLVPTGC